MTKTCALCSAHENLDDHAVPPKQDVVTLCATCAAGVAGDVTDAPHWRCLNDAIWSTEAATQVTAYRLLHRLKAEGWARDLLDIAYLEPEVLSWAEDGLASDLDLIHRDSNGVVLSAGDTVVLIKDLNVKGTSFTAKRGTSVRGISLVQDNETHIEGRVNGQQIVILTQFVKKSG